MYNRTIVDAVSLYCAYNSTFLSAIIGDLNMKRIVKHRSRICFVLVLLCVFFTFEATAAEKSFSTDPRTKTLSNISNLLDSVLIEPEAYGLSTSDFTNLSLGEQIPTYRVESRGLTETETYLYPLYSNNKLIAHITSFYHNGVLNSGFSTALATAMSNLPNKVTAHAIVYDYAGTNIVWENGTALAYECTDVSLSSMDTLPSTISIALSTTNEANTIPVSYSPTSAANSRGSGYAVMSVYRYYQGSSSLCWAYSVASIGNTLSGAELHSGVSIARALHGDDYNHGATAAQAINTLNDSYTGIYYTVRTASNSTLTESVAYDFIDAGYPIYMHHHITGHNHATVLRLINTSTKIFGIMNPATGSYETYSYSGTDYAYVHNGNTLLLQRWAV